MDQGTCKCGGELLDQVDEGVDESSSHLDEGVATDAGDGGRFGDSVNVIGEDGTSEEMCSDLSLNQELDEEEVKGQEVGESQEIDNTLHGVDQGSSYESRNLVRAEVLETCVVIDPSAQIENFNGGDNEKLEAKVNESGLSNASMKAPKAETDQNSCTIDIKCGSSIDIKCGSCEGFSNENLEGEMICRICHLASGQPLEGMDGGATNSATSTDLIQLGCACKDELGIAHSHCAEAWFKLKGNRSCEICGETAKNVPTVTDTGFTVEWNESRFVVNGSTTSSGVFGRCWRAQPFCNFLMGCLVIAFVLPWFFRVSMFS